MFAEFPKSLRDEMDKMNKVSLDQVLLTAKVFSQYRFYINEVRRMIQPFFKTPKKIDLWIQTPNPMLGDVTPLTMLLMGRHKKLKQWIESRLEENQPMPFLMSVKKVKKKKS